MKREIATNCLQLGDHMVIVDAGSPAEAHWLGLGYQFSGGSVGEGGASHIDQSEVRRRGRKPAKSGPAEG